MQMGFKPGDILGFSGDSWWSAGINIATYGIPWWHLSHVAILGEVTADPFPGHEKRLWFADPDPIGGGISQIKTMLLFESTRSCGLPCAIQGKVVQGVQTHRVMDRVIDYPGKVWHYPLYRELRPLESRRLTAFLLEHLGKDYDEIGAFRAGGVGFSFIESLFRPEDLSSLFCSEYCMAAHKHINLFTCLHDEQWRVGSASRWSPNCFARFERRQGILLKSRRLK